jgi:hypothetical protein
MRLYENQNLKKLNDRDAQKKLDEIMELLDKHRDDELLPAKYIHFQRQKDYVFLNGQQVVEHLYLFEDFPGFLSGFAQITGIHLSDEKKDGVKKINQSPFLYRNKFLQSLIQAPRPLKGRLFPLLPESIRSAIKKTIFIPAKIKTNELFLSESVRTFIQDYYRDDLKLYEGLAGVNERTIL